MRKTLQLIWHLQSKIKIKWEILSTFVAFSECMNFIRNKVKSISFTVWLQCVLFDFLGHWQYSPDVRSNGESDFAHWTDDRTGLWHPCQEQRTLHHITSGFDVFQARFSDIYLGLTLVDLNFFITGFFEIWLGFDRGSLGVRCGFAEVSLGVWWGLLSVPLGSSGSSLWGFTGGFVVAWLGCDIHAKNKEHYIWLQCIPGNVFWYFLSFDISWPQLCRYF